MVASLQCYSAQPLVCSASPGVTSGIDRASAPTSPKSLHQTWPFLLGWPRCFRGRELEPHGQVSWLADAQRPISSGPRLSDLIAFSTSRLSASTGFTLRAVLPSKVPIPRTARENRKGHGPALSRTVNELLRLAALEKVRRRFEPIGRL